MTFAYYDSGKMAYLFFTIALIISFLTGEAARCGTAQYVTKVSKKGSRCVMTLNLKVKLGNQFTEPLEAVHTGGRYVNVNTSRFENIYTPGRKPKVRLTRKTYQDVWKLFPDSGLIQLWFPYVRASSSYARGQFCFGALSYLPTFIIPGNCKAPRTRHVFNLETKVGDDFVFVIDSTGSMADDLESVKTSALDILSLFEGSRSFRIGFVQYNDPLSNVIQEFSNDFNQIRRTIDGLQAEGGGDFEEHVYSGLKNAYDMDWRPGASRSILLLGDAPPKDPEPGTLFTEALISSFANSVNVVGGTTPSVRIFNNSNFPWTTHNVRVATKMEDSSLRVTLKGASPLFAVSIGKNSKTISSFRSLAEKTEGKFFEAEDNSDVVETVKDAIKVAISVSPAPSVTSKPSSSSTTSPTPSPTASSTSTSSPSSSPVPSPSRSAAFCRGDVIDLIPGLLCASSKPRNAGGPAVKNPNDCALSGRWIDNLLQTSEEIIIPASSVTTLPISMTGRTVYFTIRWFIPSTGRWRMDTYVGSKCQTTL